jgi:hypothetical protein
VVVAAFPAFDLTDLDLSRLDAVRLVDRSARTASRLARDTGYVVVGLGVMAYLEARRRSDRI